MASSDRVMIEYAIYEADISQGLALEGGCGPIARAIHSVFGGKYAVVVDDEGFPRHAAVYANGHLFDGTGQTTTDALCSLFVDNISPKSVSSSVTECDYIRLREQLSEFRQDKSLTDDVIQKLRQSIDDV